MSNYVVQRALALLLTAFIAVTMNFVLFRLAPGDPATRLARVPNASPELQQSIREELGLDESLGAQYLSYLNELAHGNLGTSYTNREPVAKNLWRALLNTLPLLLVSIGIAVGLGLLLGIGMAWQRGGWLDRLGVGTALVCWSLPFQWVGLVLITTFAGVLPAGGSSDPFLINAPFWERAADYAWHMVLPATTLALVSFGYFAVVVRSTLRDALAEDYILAARGRGFSDARVVLRHALPNAMIPITSLIALYLAFVVSGSVIVETVFGWPGLGLEMFQAVGERDYPMLQGGFLMITFTVLVLNFIADLIQLRLDPRIRTG